MKTDYTRIYKDGIVYIPKVEADEFLEADILPATSIYGISCVSEKTYNDWLAKDPNLFKKNAWHNEFTRFTTLRASAESIIDSLSLGAQLLHLTDIDREYEIRLGEETEKIKKNPDLLKSYNEVLKNLHNKDLIDQDKMKEIGLGLQFVTEFNLIDYTPKLNVYVVGKGFFYEVWLEDCSDEFWSNPVCTPEGIIIQKTNYDFQMENYLIKPYKTDRDFRNYPVFTNMAWCFENCPVGSGWAGTVDCGRNGISFSTDITLLVELFNKRAFGDFMYIGKIVDFGIST